MFRRLASTTILLLPLVSIAPARAGDGSNHVQVEPKDIRIGMFYSGQVIRMKASMPASEGIVMRMSGPEEPLVLKKKGKKYGVLWMNVGEVHYEAVPTLYILRSSHKLDKLANAETLDRLKIGFDALRNQVPAGSNDGASELFGELVKLKERDLLFSSEAPGVQLSSGGTGRRLIEVAYCRPPRTMMAGCPMFTDTIRICPSSPTKSPAGTARVRPRRMVYC